MSAFPLSFFIFFWFRISDAMIEIEKRERNAFLLVLNKLEFDLKLATVLLAQEWFTDELTYLQLIY